MARFFGLGVLAVGISIILEKGIYMIWEFLSPDTAHLFFSETGTAFNIVSILLVGLVSFGVVALCEEGARYFLMKYLMNRSPDLDQKIDGVQFGISLGLGFAFLENTLYFLKLFRDFEFDTLVIVFFLRFLISTLGHMSFGGIMGYYFAQSRFYPTETRQFNIKAFAFPFLMHGFFDFLLAIQLSFYTVLLLTVPVFVLWLWWHDERMFQKHVLNGRNLKFPVSETPKRADVKRKLTVEVLPAMGSCPNCYVPITEEQTKCRACGVKFHRKKIISRLPFLSANNVE